MTKDSDYFCAFLAIVGAGLWEKDVRLLSTREMDLWNILRMAEEQSVIGLVASGIEHIVDFKVSQDFLLRIAGDTILIERRNAEMNFFLGSIAEKLGKAGIDFLLLKGQGIAQCYARPLWRANGDIDLLLSDSNYVKAKSFFFPLASRVDKERDSTKHLAMMVDRWEIEIHGSLRSRLWPKLDIVLDSLQRDSFERNAFRTWLNGKTRIKLLNADDDTVFVFSHIIKHLFRGGIGLRQICDWCRLLWTYKDSINKELLADRLRAMGLLSEWKVLAAVAVSHLGMPETAMLFYSKSLVWRRKSDRIMSFILETGNFGHNRDRSYIANKQVVARKLITLWRQIEDNIRLMTVFPIDSMKSLWFFFINGIRTTIKKK